MNFNNEREADLCTSYYTKIFLFTLLMRQTHTQQNRKNHRPSILPVFIIINSLFYYWFIITHQNTTIIINVIFYYYILLHEMMMDMELLRRVWVVDE